MADRGKRSAFPVKHSDWPDWSGMTYREWLAGQIMAGYRTNEHAESSLVARDAVRDADALIAELAKETR